ncbi:Predicted arabinose efflux permease, MFS family [Rhizobium sp. RU35A]|uniref:MFS transporter n=1 Tax=Rhizobium sp. RU35A TaxID=1907414 RepID=UPI000953D721|nr:MFS transporter [Rhizobium sp. RU35A]SIQ32980.1 Predicted arabinose efflux permease, MFS family [Rhizobium sp. RU35A]
MSDPHPTGADGSTEGPSTALIATIGLAAGSLVANIYYAQPLVREIAGELGIDPDLAGALTSTTQIGYGIGLFFLVSLADLVENRRLVLVTLSITLIGLIGMGLSTSVVPFFLFSFLIGVCSTGAQVLIPFIAHKVPVEKRGRVVGNVMAAVLTGIMLARPVSLFVAGTFGWRAIFFLSAALMAAIGLALFRMMPKQAPESRMRYHQVIASMGTLLRETPVLRWRSAYQAIIFCAFNLFWTAIPFALSERFALSQHQIGLFALAGAGGALAAPIVGRLADRGLGLVLSATAMVGLAVFFAVSGYAVMAGALVLLAMSAVLIDAAVQANQIVSQRIIFAIAPEKRGRLNAIYMTSAFIGGAFGSTLGTLTYHWGGWTGTASVGAGLGVLGVVLFALEQAGRRTG